MALNSRSRNAARENRPARAAMSSGLVLSLSARLSAALSASTLCLVEQHAGDAVLDRLERAARRERHDRLAGRLRLDRDDAEILGARKHQRPAGLHHLDHLAIVGAAVEDDARAGDRPERVQLRPCPDHVERQAHPRSGGDGQVDALVGQEARHDEQPLAARPGREPLGLDRGIDDLGVDPVSRADPGADVCGVGQVQVGSAGRPAIPPSERGGQRGGRRAYVPPRQVVVTAVEPACGRVAVHDMSGLRCGPDAVGPAARAADDEVLVERPQAAKGSGIKRRERAEASVEREAVERRSPDFVLTELGEGGGRAVERRIDRRLRPDARQLEHHSLGTAPLVEVVVNDRDSRGVLAHGPEAKVPSGNGSTRTARHPGR